VPTLQPEWLRYVVLRHEGIAEPHFDLMFETGRGSTLASWRSPVWPIDVGLSLEPLGDHRREYLEYEGAVSGDRGYVKRVARGRHRVLQDESNVLVVELEDGSIYRLPRTTAALT